MKIIHFFNPAAVASVLAKFTDRIYGTESLVAITKKWNRSKITYYGEVWDTNKVHFALKFLWAAREYDIIHIHVHDVMLQPCATLHPSKPRIMHYHGTDIRGRWQEKSSMLKYANKIIVSTPDLLEGAPENVEYLPNPVDTDLFYPGEPIYPNTGFHLEHGADDLVKEYADVYGIDLITNPGKGAVPHPEMPDLIRQYGWYIDVKRDKRTGKNVLLANSKVGLEALACGLKVIRWDGEVVEGLPSHHRPEEVAKRLYEIYRELHDG